MFHVLGQMFHVGMLVEDLDVAMAELSEAHGVTWASVRDWPMEVWLPGRGPVSMEIRLTYTREAQGDMRLEIIEGTAGTPVDPAQGTGVHHIGYFVEDAAVETERLIAQGGTLVMSAVSPEDGYGRFSYVRMANGLLVEPVSVVNRERFEAWWAGGELRPPSKV